MKTTLTQSQLFNIAYSDLYCPPERFVARPDLFCFVDRKSTFRFSFDGTNFYVLARAYRTRTWSILFSSSSPQHLLQDFYDFIFS